MRTKVSDRAWKRLQDTNTVYLKPFFKNVDYLSRKRFGSRNKAILALRSLEYSADANIVNEYKNGIQTDCRVSVLSKWCLLFDLPLPYMLGTDIQAEDERKGS